MPKIVIPPSSTIKIPEKISVPYGQPNRTSVYVKDRASGSEKDYTEYLIYWDFVAELNKLEICKLTFAGLTESDFDTYIKRRNTFKLFAEHHFVGKFRIEEVKRKENYLIEVKGIGMGVTLQDAITDQSTYVYRSTASDSIVEDLCTEMTIQTNENLGNVTGSFSWEDKLSALTTIADYFQADWWVDQVHPFDTDRFNIRKRRGRIPVVRNYYDSGDNRNATISKRVNTEFHFNDIVLRGKRDMRVRMEAMYENINTPASKPISVWGNVMESNKMVIRISTDKTPVYCYFVVNDGSDDYKMQEISVVGGRDVCMMIDVSNVNMGGVFGKPETAGIEFKSNSSGTSNVKIWLGRTIPIFTQFSAVSDYYTKLTTDLPKPVEGTPFDMAVTDSVWFPSKGIVKVGSDPIGYLWNEGNVLGNCLPDVASGDASAHRAGVLVFPSYDASDKADTFLTESCTESSNTLYVQDTSGFPNSGRIIISDEVMYYTSKTPTSFVISQRAVDGTVGGKKPHSKYTRVFEYSSANRFIPSFPKDGSLIDLEGLKSGKFYDRSLEDVMTAEIMASSILEANLEDNVIAEGGLITVTVEPDDPWTEMQKVGLGDTIYVNSTIANLDGKYRIKKIRWFFNPKFGHKMIIEAGSKKSLFVEKLMSKWKLLAD